MGPETRESKGPSFESRSVGYSVYLFVCREDACRDCRTAAARTLSEVEERDVVEKAEAKSDVRGGILSLHCRAMSLNTFVKGRVTRRRR